MDVRAKEARYFDRNPNFPKDVPFYQRLIPSRKSRILELGCGTGRVLVPLSSCCAYIHGIDLSDAMVAVSKNKLMTGGIPESSAAVEVGDITAFNLNRRFDLIVAPWRVVQNLETDAELHGLFDCIRAHLAPTGTCVLDAFNPYAGPHDVRREWAIPKEKVEWQVPSEGGILVCSSVTAGIDADKMVLHPEMIYRLFDGEKLVDEVKVPIVMRCYYPEEFRLLITSHGFRILNEWGGYAAQPYGEGPELLVQFGLEG